MKLIVLSLLLTSCGLSLDNPISGEEFALNVVKKMRCNSFTKNIHKVHVQSCMLRGVSKEKCQAEAKRKRYEENYTKDCSGSLNNPSSTSGSKKIRKSL